MSNNAIKPVASLDASLLARKGHAEPAVKATAFTNPQLAWEQAARPLTPPRPRTSEESFDDLLHRWERAVTALREKADNEDVEPVSTPASPPISPPVSHPVAGPDKAQAEAPALEPIPWKVEGKEKSSPVGGAPVDEASVDKSPVDKSKTDRPAPTAASASVGKALDGADAIAMIFKIDERAYLRLKYQAQKEGRSAQALVRDAVEALLDKTNVPRPTRWSVRPEDRI